MAADNDDKSAKDEANFVSQQENYHHLWSNTQQMEVKKRYPEENQQNQSVDLKKVTSTEIM